MTGADQLEPGIGQERCTRIRHQRNISPRLQYTQNGRQRAAFVMRIERDQRGAPSGPAQGV